MGEQLLERPGVRPVELEAGDEVVVGRFDGIPRVVQFAVDPIDVIRADGNKSLA